MRRIDELPLTSPFAGARMLRDLLRRSGHAIGRRHVSTLRRLSNTLTTDFCIEAVQETINRYGEPEIFNTDQGCQFTNLDFTGLLKDNGVQICMNGKDC
jgi:transposase InsO family protein